VSIAQLIVVGLFLEALLSQFIKLSLKLLSSFLLSESYHILVLQNAFCLFSLILSLLQLLVKFGQIVLPNGVLIDQVLFISREFLISGSKLVLYFLVLRSVVISIRINCFQQFLVFLFNLLLLEFLFIDFGIKFSNFLFKVYELLLILLIKFFHL